MTSKMKFVSIPKVMVPTVNLGNLNRKNKGNAPKKNRKLLEREMTSTAQRRPRNNNNRVTGGGRTIIKSHPLLGGLNMVSNTGSVPTAFVDILGNTTFLSEPLPVLHPELGIQGVNLHGCQPLSDIAFALGDGTFFTTGTLATALDAFSIYLNPDTLNGPLAAQANLHAKYVFRDVLIEYITNANATIDGALAMSISEGGSVSDPTTFSTIRQLVPSITCPVRAERAYLHYNYSGYQLFTTLQNAGTNLSINEFVNQLVLNGHSQGCAVASGAYTNIFFSIDLYDPISTQGFTVMVNSREQQFYLKSLFQLIKAGRFDFQTLVNSVPVKIIPLPPQQRLSVDSRYLDSLIDTNPSSSSNSNFTSHFSNGYEVLSRSVTPQIPIRK